MDTMALLKYNTEQWMRFSDYELRTDPDGQRYIVPIENAVGSMYVPAEHVREIMLDAVEIGKQLTKELPVEVVEGLILGFVRRHGLLGIMPELPMNDNFAEIKQTLLSESWFFPAGVAATEQYIGMFFPFNKEMAEIAPSDLSVAALSGREPVYELAFSRYYGEKVQWIATYFYELFRCFFAYLNFDDEDDAELRANSRKIIAEFPKHKMRYGINSATRLSVHFTSLKALIDFAFTTSITKEEKPMKMCKHCNKVYYNENARSEFCSGRCRNQWNVYKSRGALKASIESSLNKQTAEEVRKRLKNSTTKRKGKQRNENLY